MNSIIRFVFEQLPLIKWLDGKKRVIGTVLVGAGALSEVLRQRHPELPHLDEFQTQLATVLGWFSMVFGEAHARVKEKANG